MNIEDYIPYGKDKAVTRQELSIITGLNDRQLRKCISVARREHPILNLQNGKGYYMPTVGAWLEAEEFLKQETKRARSIFWGLRGTRKWLKKHKE